MSETEVLYFCIVSRKQETAMSSDAGKSKNDKLAEARELEKDSALMERDGYKATADALHERADRLREEACRSDD